MIPDWTMDVKRNGTEPTLAVANIICDSHPWGLRDILVFGDRGLGKTVYSLKVMEQVFKAYGCNEDEAWQLSLNSLIFRIDDFIKFARDVRKRGWVYPVITIDDAGSGFGSKQFFSNRHLVDKLKGVLDTARTWTSGMIFTTPNSGGLLKDIRNMHSFEAKVIRTSGPRIVDGKEYPSWQRAVKAIRKQPGYGGKQWFSKKKGYVDEFSAHLPDWKYQQYWEKRCEFSDHALDDLDKTQEEKPDAGGQPGDMAGHEPSTDNLQRD